MNYLLSDILFYPDLPDFLGFKRFHTCHLVTASELYHTNPENLQNWRQRHAMQQFPMYVGTLGKCRFWLKSEVLDWAIDNSPKYFTRVKNELDSIQS